MPAQGNTSRDSPSSQSEDHPSIGTVAVTQPPSSESQEQPPGHRRKSIKKFVRAGKFWIELGTFWVILAYTLIANNQWKEMQQAAQAAEGANRLTSKNLVEVQRPWIAVDGPMVSIGKLAFSTTTISQQGPQTQITGGVDLWIKNFGVAPAFHISIHVTPAIYQQHAKLPDLMNGFKESVISACRIADLGSTAVSLEDSGNGFYMFPGNRIPLRFTINSTSPSPETRTWFTMVGCISYRDQFKGTPMHHTRFCFRSPQGMTQVVANQAFYPCGQNEEAD